MGSLQPRPRHPFRRVAVPVITRPADLPRQAVDGAAAARACFGVDDGMPFVLGADGSYDLHLNRFFRELDSWGARSEHTREAYARDLMLMLFGRFLHQHRGGRTIWQARPDARALVR